MTELQATGNIGDDRETINANFTEAAAHAADTVKHVTAEDKAFWNDTGADLTGHMLDHNNPHEATAEQIGAIPASQKGAANGVAATDSNGRIPIAQMPKGVISRASETLSTTGWYRIASAETLGTTTNLIIQIRRTFTNTPPETYAISLCIALSKLVFSTINCSVMVQGIKKIRVVKSQSGSAGESSHAFIEIYYDLSVSNSCNVQIVNNYSNFTVANFTAGEIPNGYAATEYSLPIQSLEERIAALEGGA